jgi:uncharacterized protein YheU (UPF0270 family)
MNNSKQVNLIPHTKLSPEALRNLIEQFVSRDGVDSGHMETPLNRKVENVKSQLNSGDIVIVFDHHSQTCNIIPKDQIPSVIPLSQ